jgi:glycosyltransferase involved in cell wall biosynthesis
MSYGVPVISMRCDGIRYLNTTHEYIKQDVNGFLAENRMQFRNIVEKICAKPNLLYEIANNARTAIEEKYTWEKHIERYERIFLKMKKTE